MGVLQASHVERTTDGTTQQSKVAQCTGQNRTGHGYSRTEQDRTGQRQNERELLTEHSRRKSHREGVDNTHTVELLTEHQRTEHHICTHDRTGALGLLQGI